MYNSFETNHLKIKTTKMSFAYHSDDMFSWIFETCRKRMGCRIN